MDDVHAVYGIASKSARLQSYTAAVEIAHGRRQQLIAVNALRTPPPDLSLFPTEALLDPHRTDEGFVDPMQRLLSLWSAPSPLQGPPNTAVISSALSGAVYYGALKPRPLPWPSPTTSQSKASGAPPRQSQSAGGPPRLSPPPPPIPAAHVQGTKPVGLRPAVSSVPKTPRVVWVGSHNYAILLPLSLASDSSFKG